MRKDVVFIPKAIPRRRCLLGAGEIIIRNVHTPGDDRSPVRWSSGQHRTENSRGGIIVQAISEGQQRGMRGYHLGEWKRWAGEGTHNGETRASGGAHSPPTHPHTSSCAPEELNGGPYWSINAKYSQTQTANCELTDGGMTR